MDLIKLYVCIADFNSFFLNFWEQKKGFYFIEWKFSKLKMKFQTNLVVDSKT